MKNILKKWWFWLIIFLSLFVGIPVFTGIVSGIIEVIQNPSIINENVEVKEEIKTTEKTDNASKQEKNFEELLKNQFIGYDIENIENENSNLICSVSEKGDPLKTITDKVIDKYVYVGGIVFKEDNISRFTLKITVIDYDNVNNKLTYEISTDKETYEKYNWISMTDERIYNIFNGNENIKMNIY